MAHSLSFGVCLTLLAGLMAGNCMLPMKFNRSWQWENTWLAFSVVSLVILPWLLALGLVDHVFDVYRSLSLIQFSVPFLFGVGWGVAQVLFGISVARLGLGLAYAIIVGLGALLGTLVPLFTQHRSQVHATALVEILAGVAVMVIGISLSTAGGQIRERNQSPVLHSEQANGYTAAVLLAILCGLMAPMLNYSFAFGQDVATQAELAGNSALRSAYAVWPIGLAGGFLPNIAYSLYLLRKKKSWKLFQATSPDIFWSVLMGVLWMGAMALYGMSATYLGSFGTSIGWGMFQIFMIMTAALSGVMMGEWKGAPRRARSLLGMGLVCLTGATALLAMGNH
ncbi:MAG TPA: L-rhamnose/proton symporter RhaT [Terracidiphilus sp.]|nr:L-rhamnose/proton symporter RhaT [Terracidiphilus sp.]